MFQFSEYGLTEASTGISVGSQPPLVIPSTQPGDTSPYQPVVNAVHVPLIRTQSLPSNAYSPRTAKKRLSVVSSETASSMESSSSSGVYDLNLPATDEENSIRTSIAPPLEEKLSKSGGKRNKVRKISTEKSPWAHLNNKERLVEEVSFGSTENLSERRKSSVEETPDLKLGKDKLVVTQRRTRRTKRSIIFSNLFLFGRNLLIGIDQGVLRTVLLVHQLYGEQVKRKTVITLHRVGDHL